VTIVTPSIKKTALNVAKKLLNRDFTENQRSEKSVKNPKKRCFLGII